MLKIQSSRCKPHNQNTPFNATVLRQIQTQTQVSNANAKQVMSDERIDDSQSNSIEVVCNLLGDCQLLFS